MIVVLSSAAFLRTFFIPKLVYIVKILTCKNGDPWTTTGAPGRIQSLTQKYVGKMFKILLPKN